MKGYWVRVVVGVLLIAAGAVALLQNLGLLPSESGVIWAFLFGAGGVIFITVYLTDRAQWWPLIPAGSLLGLAAVIGLSLLDAELAGIGGAAFLGCAGLPFVVIYLTDREQWWAIIPGGSLITLAAVAGLAEPLGGAAGGGILFLGLAGTFGLLSLVDTPKGRLRWALIPAAVLALLGVGLMVNSPQGLVYVFAGAAILAGVWIVGRTLRAGRRM
jgi:hypothetical protein